MRRNSTGGRVGQDDRQRRHRLQQQLATEFGHQQHERLIKAL